MIRQYAMNGLAMNHVWGIYILKYCNFYKFRYFKSLMCLGNKCSNEKNIKYPPSADTF